MIVGVSELLYAGSKIVDPSVPIHIEVLLPAFVLGCLARPRAGSRRSRRRRPSSMPCTRCSSGPSEKRAATASSPPPSWSLVGLSMPAIFGGADLEHPAPTPASLHAAAPGSAVDDPSMHGGDKEGRYTDDRHRQPAQSGLGHDRVACLACSRS